MNYCYYIFGLRLPFGLRFDLQSHPPNRLIKFLFVGSRTLLPLIVKVVVSKNIYFLFVQVIRYCSVPDHHHFE